MEMYIEGERFPHEVKEGLSGYFDGNSVNIVLGYDKVTEGEYKAFRENEIEFYLSYINKTFFICIRADNLIDLSDAAIYLDIKGELRLVEKGEESYPVHMFLVDTSTNTFLGARILGISNEASRNMSAVLKGMEGDYPSLDEYKENATSVMGMLKTENIKELAFSEYKSKPSIL
jgi:hypothetical protein